MLSDFARQIINERMQRSDRSLDALLTVAGSGAHALIREATSGSYAYIPGKELIEYVLYGVHPKDAIDAGFMIKNPYSSDNTYGLSDPLQIAAFYGRFGRQQDAIRMLELRKEIVTDYKEQQRRVAAKGKDSALPPYKSPWPAGFWGSYYPARALKATWATPDVTKWGLPRVEYTEGLDTLYCAAWFNDIPILACINGASHGQSSGILEALSQIADVTQRDWSKEINAAARERAIYYMLTNAGGTRTRYYEVARYIRLLTNEDAADIFERVKGARAALTLTHPSTSTKHYVKGLRALAGVADDTRAEILRRLGRGPTLAELRQVRSVQIINIIDEMPWENIGALIEEHGSTLRGLCLPYIDRVDPAILNRFLTPHRERLTSLLKVIKGRLLREELTVGNKKLTDWEHVFGDVQAYYVQAEAVRARLNQLTGDPAVSFLALLKPYKLGSVHIDNALKKHPNYAEIEQIVEAYKVPSVSALY
jgi:hypothetical protein